MNKLTLFCAAFVFCVLFMSGCTVNIENGTPKKVSTTLFDEQFNQTEDNPQKIENTPAGEIILKGAAENNDDLITMKKSCASYRSDIITKMNTTNWSSYIVDEVFFSPQKQSCLYAVFAMQNKRNVPYSAYIIWDYFTGEMLFYRDTTLTNDQDLSAIYKNARGYLGGIEQLKYDERDWNLD